MTDFHSKIATMERLYIEVTEGPNERDDADIRGATSGLKHVTTAGYFDVVKKSDLLRILPDSVIKDSRRSRDVKLETSFYERRRRPWVPGPHRCRYMSFYDLDFKLVLDISKFRRFFILSFWRFLDVRFQILYIKI